MGAALPVKINMIRNWKELHSSFDNFKLNFQNSLIP